MSEHKYLDLNIGLVKENFAVVKNDEIELWKSRGFETIENYPIFHYIANKNEAIMLGKPLFIEEFGLEQIKGSKIIDISTCLGTYGMGGPGFFGLKLEGVFGIRWLVYCIWAAGQHILLDGKVLECHPDYEDKYKPWIESDNWAESLNKLKDKIVGMSIDKIVMNKDKLLLRLIDSNSKCHTLKTYKFSRKFPEQGGTKKKRNSYETGKMEDYWMIVYDGSHLKV